MITVRLAGPEDAAAIAHVHVAGWQHFRGLVPDAYLDALDPVFYAGRWQERIIAPAHGVSNFTFVADDPPGEVIGFAHGCREREAGDPTLGEVAAIYVLASYRGHGAGRRLTVALASHLASLGCRSLMIWVLTENHSARRFYEALGGRAAHERIRPIGGAELPETGYRWDDLRLLMRPVTLSPPDPAWASALAEEGRRVAAALGCDREAVEPIGSTSVPGLVAKPILDLMVGLPALPLTREQILAAARLGYDFHGYAGIPGRQYFSRSEPHPTAQHPISAAHVHVTVHDSQFWRDHLRFRDYLRSHPAAAAEYAALKQRVAAETDGNRIDYLAGKAEFIAGILARAGGQ